MRERPEPGEAAADRPQTDRPEADRPRAASIGFGDGSRVRPADLELRPGAVPPPEAAERIGEFKREYVKGLASARPGEVRLPDELAGLRDTEPPPLERGPIERIRAWRDRVRGTDAPDEAALRIDRPDSGDPYAQRFPPNRYEADALRQPDGQRKPLFDGPPRREDTQQGVFGDCGIIADLGAVAGTDPQKITDAIKENPDGTYSVTLNEVRSAWPEGFAETTGRKITYTVTPDLPVREFDGELVGAKAGRVAWPAVLEKAIAGSDQAWTPEQKAEWEERWAGQKAILDRERVAQGKEPFPDAPTPTGYTRISQGSNVYDRADLLTALTGRQAEVRHIPDTDDALIKDFFIDKLAYDKPIIVGSRPRDRANREPPFPKQLEAGHAYEVTGLTPDGRIQLRNPWNRLHPEPLTLDEFREFFRQKRPDGTREGHYTTLA